MARKQKKLDPEGRRQELTRKLLRKEKLSTEDEARYFGVNTMTIRRDLKTLVDSGVALRSYGGAIAAQRINFEFAYDKTHQSNFEEKKRIGAEAVTRIESDQTVFLDTGTTTLEIAKALIKKNIRCQVITNSLVIASELWGRGHIELFLLGGRARSGSPDLIGAPAWFMLDRFSADIAFLGSEGVDPDRGCFVNDMDVAMISERMSVYTKQVIVVSDYSKFGKIGKARYLPIERIGEIITDDKANKNILDAFREKGVKVTTV